MGYRDRDAFNAILSALDSTGAFAEVRLADAVDAGAVGADRLPIALLAPVGWDEAPDSDPSSIVRRVTFDLTLMARDDDAVERFGTLDLLSSIAANALDGASLGGPCLAGSSRVTRGVFAPGKARPEGRLTLSGEFSYVVNPVVGHDTTP